MKATKLTILENGKRVWREDAFEGGVMSRAELVNEFNQLGFVHYDDPHYESWEMWLPEDMHEPCGNRNMLYVSIDFSLGVKGLRSSLNKDHIDGYKITTFTKETVIEITVCGVDSRAYRLGDMWQGIRQRWDELYHYDAYCKGKHKVEDLVWSKGINN